MHIQSATDHSVKFGRSPDMGLEGQKAFPFIYTFVNHNDDTWKPVTGATQPSLANCAVLVKASSNQDVGVLLDPDYNFKLIGIKYCVYNYNTESRIGPANAYIWHSTVQDVLGAEGCHNGEENFLSIPLVNYISMTLAFQGSGSTIIYGGQNPGMSNRFNATYYDSITPIDGNIPMPIEAVQGYEYGFYRIRTPYLLPRQGVMSFTIKNSHPTSDLYVAALIYGMKIRV